MRSSDLDLQTNIRKTKAIIISWTWTSKRSEFKKFQDHVVFKN